MVSRTLFLGFSFDKQPKRGFLNDPPRHLIWEHTRSFSPEARMVEGNVLIPWNPSSFSSWLIERRPKLPASLTNPQEVVLLSPHKF